MQMSSFLCPIFSKAYTTIAEGGVHFCVLQISPPSRTVKTMVSVSTTWIVFLTLYLCISTTKCSDWSGLKTTPVRHSASLFSYSPLFQKKTKYAVCPTTGIQYIPLTLTIRFELKISTRHHCMREEKCAFKCMHDEDKDAVGGDRSAYGNQDNPGSKCI